MSKNVKENTSTSRSSAATSSGKETRKTLREKEGGVLGMGGEPFLPVGKGGGMLGTGREFLLPLHRAADLVECVDALQLRRHEESRADAGNAGGS